MPRVDNPNAIANTLPGMLARVKAITDDIKSASQNAIYSLVVGMGGAVINGTSQFIGAVIGPLNVTGSVSASTTITAVGAVAGASFNGATITSGAFNGATVAAGAIGGASVAVTGAASSATSAVTGSSTVGGNSTVSGQIFIPNGFAAVSGYTIAYINNDGRISVGASAARFKQDFQPVHAEPLIAGIYAANLLHFRLIAAVDEIDGKMGPLREGEQRGTAAIEIGLLADQLETIGLGEFVYRDGGGAVLGIQYERLTVPLIAVVQSLDRRLRAGGL